jgi:hypothetical protein
MEGGLTTADGVDVAIATARYDMFGGVGMVSWATYLLN